MARMGYYVASVRNSFTKFYQILFSKHLEHKGTFTWASSLVKMK